MTLRLDVPALPGRVGQLAAARPGARVMVGIVGPPGAGKSTVAERLAAQIGRQARVLPMDGFHLAQRELDRLGRADRKGAPDTFDVDGYVSALARVRADTPGTVYAPAFERSIEEPIACALPFGPDVRVVLTEGNYLLHDAGGWEQVRPLLDECWYLDVDDAVRVRRLVDRHVRYGRPEAAARAWVDQVDERNTALVARGRARADALVALD
ncbi:nucleoside/nucleotide kinase family protein [Cellulomonas chengniuliangii]|uniref:Nucleoside/nucleotide kinase family protein n=1 Tax=Cellulomonas chengniuliangii TaxID=2968084 RepID=A0ABY5KX59_9CELL|nr:nucleoside/nucleotide kinase family protein [Cellulomonas chengniuliangii]MCC2309361.1 nucleoside/nucleotide kinase family protein [Cellulomonas chengniuliangii]MCC2316631.1 nucleoside/nucleotide kinase family protein [Cellulomonas chengniuliangii]UUI75072.1 nucleoside/nucleotide kinase family protein [Cellulomonas chengniuliangii]